MASSSTCSYEYLTAIYSFRKIEEQKVFSLLELPLLSLLHFLALLPHSCRLQLAASYKFLHRSSEEARKPSESSQSEVHRGEWEDGAHVVAVCPLGRLLSLCHLHLAFFRPPTS